MKVKKIKTKVSEPIIDSKNSIIYKCEKCGYESPKTFLTIFENVEHRYCLKCVNDFYMNTFPKALKK
jgi:transposase-like protein